MVQRKVLPGVAFGAMVNFSANVKSCPLGPSTGPGGVSSTLRPVSHFAVGMTFIPMALLDVPSTIMSLGGIAIAIGATVDAEIVMVEACHKKLEEQPNAQGEARRRLLAEAAREVTPAIASMSR